MAGFLTTASSLMCPHGGTVTISSTDTRVQTADGPILRPSDVFTVGGCPFFIGTVAHPCMTLQWVVTDEMSQAMSDATLSEDGTALCQAADQAAQGSALIMVTQEQAAGS
jgi:hypothetical protein